MADRNLRTAVASVPVWSWAVAALGLLLVAGSAGFMLYTEFVRDNSPPLVTIAIDAIAPSGDGYVVKIGVINRGSSVAAGLVIEGVLSDNSSAVETSTITIDYVPSGSQRQAGLYFTRDPRTLRLQVRPKGYVDP
jgi:uncharacterized protein (TIGR02588 family)